MEQRHTIEYFHNQGLRPCQIFNQLKKFGMKRDMVYRTVKRLNETGSVADRTRSGRPASVVTKKMVASVRARIIRNPAQSQRKLARALKTSKTSMRRIIREELRLKPYKKRIVYGLTNAQKKKRHERTKKLIEVYAREKLDQIIFSDEKIFSVEETVNKQNNRVYAVAIEAIPDNIRLVQRFSHASKIMVWAGLSKKGKLPLVFVEPGVKVNAHYYLNSVLREVLKPNAENLYENGDWIFQQDSAPSHKAKICQKWLEDEIPDFIATDEWPPNSPDLNPLDYSIWGTLEERVNSKYHSSIESLKASILKEWDNLTMEEVRKSIDAWPRRLRSVLTKKGDRFE